MKISLLFILFPFLLIAQPNSNGFDSKIDKEIAEQLHRLKTSVNHNGLEEDLLNLIRIQNLYESMNIDSALVYADKEFFLAKQIGNHNLLASARIRKAKLLRKESEFKEANVLLLANLDQQFVISDSLKGITRRVLASINFRRGRFAKATEDILEAITFFSKRNDSTNLLSSYRLLAKVYDVLEDKEKAIEYYETASQFDTQLNKRLTIRLLIDNSTLLLEEGKFKESLYKIQKAELLAENINARMLKTNVYIQYARLYNAWNNDEKLLQYAQMADSILKTYTIPTTGLQHNVYKYLAKGYERQQNYNKALQYFKRIDSNTYPSIEVKSYLIRVYENIGDYELAHHTNKELNHLKDSLNLLEHNERIKEILEKYEGEKKQLQIEKLNYQTTLQKIKLDSQTRIFFASVGFLIIILIFGFIFHKNHSNKQRLKEVSLNLEKITLQQQFLRTQLNPHFIFHALSSIESYMYKGKKDQAATFLQSFSELMRDILESSDVEFISLKSDIEFIRKYLELQRLNHAFKFDYTIKIQDNIDAAKILIPPMLTQPFVENAIIHGVLHSGGKIDISVIKKAHILVIEIKDDGQSQLEDAKTSSKLNRSMSTGIVMQRIQNLKNTHNIEILYSSINNSQKLDSKAKGRTITLSIPVIYENFTRAV
nr:histidine kinase [uncultured Psychroserpens sp.]